MNKVMPVILTSMGLVAALSSSFAHAGNRPNALTATVGGGYVYLDSMRHMDNRPAGMVKLGYDFTSHLGLEALLAGFHTHFSSREQDHRQISGTLFAFDGLYHFMPDYLISPYVLAGVGIIGLSPNRSSDANNEGNLNIGAGIQWFISNSFAVQLEARDLYTWEGGTNDAFVNAGISVLIDVC